MSEAFTPFVGLAGVLVMIAAIGWVISPAFRFRMRYRAVRLLFVLALVFVAISLLSYDWK